jgi:hypothetical protein
MQLSCHEQTIANRVIFGHCANLALEGLLLLLSHQKPQIMYNGLLSAHSGTRWIVLLLIVFAVLNAFSKWRFGKTYGKGDKMLNLFAMIFYHLQFTIGLILYFVSPKVMMGDPMSTPVVRFYTIEHMLLMIGVFVLITMGRKRAEKAEKDSAKHRKYFVWYGVCLLIILAAIPWPFRIEGAGWF